MDELDYQKGRKTVESPDIDAAGDGHPLGNDPMPFDGDMQRIIRDLAEGQYSGYHEAIREYLANAETACLKVERNSDLIGADNYSPLIEVTLRKDEEKFIIHDNGIGMSSEEMDKVFRMIGHTTSMDMGDHSGQFGWGALSFAMMTGSSSEMIVTTHSRRTDENYSAIVTLAGPEPVMGCFDDDEYGTEFSMNIKDGVDMDDISRQVGKYAEWLRVPVLYHEYDENGKETMKEEYGNKTLDEQYGENVSIFQLEEPGYFTAYSHPNSNMKTLLLSMPIDRGCGDTTKLFPFDIRINDESGRIVHSTNGNKGLIPTTQSDYREMLLDAREGYVPESYLKSSDTVGAYVGDKIAVPREDYENKVSPQQKDQFIPLDEVEEDVTPIVVMGSSAHKGREVVSDEEWDSMDEGRAENYISEAELEQWDGESGDLRLPEPTTDRGRLRNPEAFMEWVGEQFDELIKGKGDDISQQFREADDKMKVLENQKPLNIVERPTGP